MHDRPKVLVLLSRIPYPHTDGTRFKVYNNILGGLSELYDVELLIVTNDRLTKEAEEALSKVSNKFHYFYLPLTVRIKNIFRAIFSSLPFQARLYRSTKALHFFVSHLKHYDAVYVHTLRMAIYADASKDTDKILIDFNDAISLNYIEAKKKASLLWRVIYSIELQRVRYYERALLLRYCYFCCVSPYDRSYLLENISGDLQKNIVFNIVPHGISDDLIGLKKEHNETITRLIFLGNLEYPPNTDAMRYFFNTVWRGIRTRYPHITLTVIGKGREIFNHAIDGVTFLGFVEDHGSELAAHDVFISPLRFGAGIPSKILEAMGVGLPILGTTFSFRGISGVDSSLCGALVERVGTVNEWVSAIEILGPKVTRARIGLHNREVIDRLYSNYQSKKVYQQLVGEIISKNSAV